VDVIAVPNADDSCDIGAYENEHGVHRPRADAGQDEEAECTSNEGALMVLDGSGSASGTGEDIVLFEWFEDFEQPSEVFLAYGEILDWTLPVGSHVITLQVTDSIDATDTDEVVKTVTDSTPPEITCPGDASGECESTGQGYVSLPPASAWDLCCDTSTLVNDHTQGGADASGSYPLGETVVNFTACDESDHCSSCDTTVTVVDTPPPEITCPEDVVAECESAGQAYVSLPLAVASDTCSEAPAIANDHTEGGPDASGLYPLGSTGVTFTACDEAGNCSSCQTTVTVMDTTPPEISVSLVPNTLWPPNHRMVDVQALVTANDSCVPPTFALTSVASDEPDDVPGGGDGHTMNDIQDADVGTADLNLRLRAERVGGGDGRTYTVAYAASDASGNEASSSGEVYVSHDLDGVTDPIQIVVDRGENGFALSWTAVEDALYYSVIRGHLSDIRETEPAIDLGSVLCAEARSLGETLIVSEAFDLPAPGNGFFYLVEFDDGTRSSYGTESASKPRTPATGDCF